MSTDEDVPTAETTPPVWEDLVGGLQGTTATALAAADGKYTPLVMLQGVPKLLGEGIYRAQDLQVLIEVIKGTIDQAKLVSVLAQSFDKAGIPREQATVVMEDLFTRTRDRATLDGLLDLVRPRF